MKRADLKAGQRVAIATYESKGTNVPEYAATKTIIATVVSTEPVTKYEWQTTTPKNAIEVQYDDSEHATRVYLKDVLWTAERNAELVEQRRKSDEAAARRDAIWRAEHDLKRAAKRVQIARLIAHVEETTGSPMHPDTKKRLEAFDSFSGTNFTLEEIAALVGFTTQEKE
jgi:hypothetical protein